VDVQDCASVFDGFFAKDKAQKVILMYDVIYAHCVGKGHSVPRIHKGHCGQCKVERVV
jgi:hypothetical protein